MARRQLVAVLATTALLAGGCGSPGGKWVVKQRSVAPGVSGNPATAALKEGWHPCADVAKEITGQSPRNVTFDCATLAVPQDWATAANGKTGDGKTFDIALIRARSSSQRDRIGSLLVNPGGPGASGIELAAYLASSMPKEVTSRFDLIGFDPRGVGRSTQVKCFSNADLDTYFGADPDPVSQQAFDETAAMSKRMAESCGQKYGDALPLFSTEQAARDMDAIRGVLGEDKLTYLGFSYGTLLGAVYAQLFPTRIRAMVLDGAMDPTQSSIQSAETQAMGFERAFDNLSTWCKANAGQCPIAPDARAAVVEAMDQARSAPLTAADGRKVTAGWVYTAVISSLYQQSDWRQLAVAINHLRSGSPAQVLELADQYAERDESGNYNNLFDANSAVNCADDDKTPAIAQLRDLQSQWRAKYPLFGASSALNLMCAQWPGKRDAYPVGPAKGAPPIVVVGTTGDPATPYEQTAKLASMLGVGTVVTWQGEGHTAYPKTRCVNDAVNHYLVDLTVPSQGLTCPAK